MKNNPNILVISSKFPPEYAGSGLRAHRTYKRLAGRYGFKHRVLTSSVAFNGLKRYTFEGVEVYRIACKPFRNIPYGEYITGENLIQKITRKLANGANYLCEAALTWVYLIKNGGRFDIIHIFGNNYVTAAALTYAKAAKKRVILEICNVSKKYIQYEPGLLKRLFGEGLARDSKVVCISNRIKDVFRKSGYTEETWCRPNPVDTARFFPERENKAVYRNELKLFEADDVVLLNIGKICPLKNQVFLLDVLKGLPDKYKLFIGGPVVSSGPDKIRDTAYFNELRSRIKAYGLAGRVKLEDRFIDNVDKYMKASDIYLLPSRIEACATPVLEAAACGIPVVAHRIDGVTTEWVREGADGYLSALEAGRFSRNIERAASMDPGPLADRSRKIAEGLSVECADRMYAKMIKELVS